MNILALNGTSNPEVCSALNSVGRSRVKTNLEQYVPTVNRKKSAVNNSDFYHQPLTLGGPKSDQHQLSPHNINISSRQKNVLRINKMITNGTFYNRPCHGSGSHLDEKATA